MIRARKMKRKVTRMKTRLTRRWRKSKRSMTWWKTNKKMKRGECGRR